MVSRQAGKAGKQGGKNKPWWKGKLNAWFGREQVRRIKLRIDNNHPISHGEGMHGKIYSGYLYPERQAGKKKAVVIKKFNRALTDDTANSYSRAIEKLRRGRFPIPKTGMYKMTREDAESSGNLFREGEWVQVQQFFGRGTETKILDRYREVERRGKQGRIMAEHVGILFSKKPEARKEAALLLTKLVNMGFMPVVDVVAPLVVSKGPAGAIPFDIDLIVAQTAQSNLYSKRFLTAELVDKVKFLAEAGEANMLIDICKENASQWLKNELEEEYARRLLSG
jgi:hypothetical protein